MAGVTTALVGFIFVCVVFPHLVKNRPQFYAALALVCGIVLVDAVNYAFVTAGSSLRVFTYFLEALMQIGAILLMFTSAGGVTWRELGDDMKNAFEVIRRGGEEKEIIIPLTGQMPRQKEAPPESPIPLESPERGEDKPVS